MDRDELRALQAPLKEQYRDEPEAAIVTLAATGSLGDGVSCSVQTGRALAEAGLHPASGGDGSLLCSGDMLLRGARRLRRRHAARSRDQPGDPHPFRDGPRRGRPRLPRHPWRRQGSPRRLLHHPPHIRPRRRRERGAARDAEEAHRALLRRLPDARERAEACDGAENGLSEPAVRWRMPAPARGGRSLRGVRTYASRRGRCLAGCRRRQRAGGHSHSMVPGGLLVMSRTTRLTSRISLIMREAICSSRS